MARLLLKLCVANVFNIARRMLSGFLSLQHWKQQKQNNIFVSSHLSASTLRGVPARIMTTIYLCGDFNIDLLQSDKNNSINNL